jgi:outer membrane protein assembly factor BamB
MSLRMSLRNAVAAGVSIWILASGPSAQESVAAASWPDYRGPRHDGHSEARGLPRSFGETENIAWKTRIHGRAWSSPVVVDRQVWLTTATDDGRQLFVLAVDLDSGEIVHDARLFAIEKPQFAHRFNTYASPSPVIDGPRVYASFGSPGTACVDRDTKRVVWQRTDLVCDHFRGAGSSPLVYRDLLILTMDGADFQYVIALDKATGETRWRTRRSTDFDDLDAKTGKPKADGDFRKSYATPIVIDVDGRQQLISPAAKAAFAYDPATGAELWTVRHQNHSSASRTVYGEGLVFINTGYPNPQLLAVDPRGSGDVTETHVRWRLSRRVPKKPSPVLVDRHLYLLSDGGVASCVVAKTGAEVWHSRVGGDYSASLVHADGRILAFSEAGRAVMFAPGAKFERVGGGELDDGCMSSPAIVGRALIVRSKSHLYRIEGAVVPLPGPRK